MIRRISPLAILVFLLMACDTFAPWGAAPAPAPKSNAELNPPSLAVIPSGYQPAQSHTLADVRRRRWLACGIDPSLPGFAFPDARGNWRGFDVDFCRVIAAATLGDATKVRFTRVSAQARFDDLFRGRIDILSRNTSMTFARDARQGLRFPVTTYYGGQGFLISKALGLNGAEEMSRARVYVQFGTTSESNLADFFGARGMRYERVIVASELEARREYESGACDAFTADVSALAASRSLLGAPNAHVILPNVTSMEPLDPVVRQEGPTWADIVRWTMGAVIVAEELGLNSSTVEEVRQTSSDPETRRLLRGEGDLGPLLDLSPDWAYQAILQVAAYNEIFRRDLGTDSALKLNRGLNALWNPPHPEADVRPADSLGLSDYRRVGSATPFSPRAVVNGHVT